VVALVSAAAGRAAAQAGPDTARATGTGPTLADVVYFPVLFGFRVPSYDRSDGVSIAWGPEVALPEDRLVVDALLTYRSNLGHVDPSIRARLAIARRLWVRATVERATLSNDSWTGSDLLNSAATLVTGSDGRNYFRADRSEAALEWHGDRPDGGEDAYLGVRDEFGRSVGPDTAPAHVVWSLFDRSSRDGVRRPNPPVARGRIGSLIAGARGKWAPAERLRAGASLDLEVPWTTPRGSHFAQLTANGTLTVRVFRDQQLTLGAHALVTAGDTAPPQRFSYIGGFNTLPTVRLLALGGDQLVSLQSEYVIPIDALAVPVIGRPAIVLRHVVGGAGVHRVPPLTQNIGGGVQAFGLELVFLVDPATRRHALVLSGAVPRL
jgi:hypothetical protein